MAEKEYIEREAAISGLNELERTSHHNSVLWPDHVEECRETLRSIPAADVQPVVRGYWKSVPHKRARICSRCEADEPYKFADVDANVYDYCPHCGANMKKSDE